MDEAMDEGGRAARPGDGHPGAGHPGDGHPSAGHPGDGWPAADGWRPSVDDPGVDGPIVIANEFSDVVVRRVMTRNGVRLDIWSPRHGTRVHLDAMQLESLTRQPPELFSDLLGRAADPS